MPSPKKTSRLLISLLLGGALTAAALYGFSVWKARGATPSSASGAPSGGPPGGRGGRGGFGAGFPVPVVVGEVKQKDVSIYLDGIGTVQAFNSVTVRARVEGQLEKVVFKEGQDVKAGDLLAVIDPRTYKAAYDQAVAKKAQDEAQLANAKTQLARNTELMTKKVMDQQTFETSQALVNQLTATVQADQAAVDAAQTQLSYTQIVAPIDGRTGVRLVDQGNVVRASDQNGIVVITQIHPISVVFTLPQQNLRAINTQFANGPLQVLAIDSDNTTQLAEGTLTVVDNQIDQATGTIKLKATFPNDNNALWPGQFVNARLRLQVRPNAVVVPASVVQRGPQGAFAYVVKADKSAEQRPIKVAQIEGGEALIEEGLRPGETVVVDGQYKLQPGSKTEVVSPGAVPSSAGAPGATGPGGADAAGQPRGERGNRPPGERGGRGNRGEGGGRPDGARPEGAKPEASPAKPGN
ncbi:MAG: efflux RND transporter periplasmic adaptor subunit [Verrucomicrobia bacterium]|nr:efflux RND transporter periplasmic adaptor subunit [Verrucomicrobiota bacterium]